MATRAAVIPTLLSTLWDAINVSDKQFGHRTASGPGSKSYAARVREDMDGIVRFLPMLGESTSPDLYLADLGVTGTVASAYLSGSREGIYNAVVARGESAPDEPAIPPVRR